MDYWEPSSQLFFNNVRTSWTCCRIPSSLLMFPRFYAMLKADPQVEKKMICDNTTRRCSWLEILDIISHWIDFKVKSTPESMGFSHEIWGVSGVSGFKFPRDRFPGNDSLLQKTIHFFIGKFRQIIIFESSINGSLIFIFATYAFFQRNFIGKSSCLSSINGSLIIFNS